jgi:hypothetical protein
MLASVGQRFAAERRHSSPQRPKEQRRKQHREDNDGVNQAGSYYESGTP